jgi:nucleotide-binding universal stress UspA family protein
MEGDLMAPARIVVGLDGSDGAHAAARWCARFAPRLDAEVIALAVVEPAVPLVLPPPAYAEMMHETEEREREQVQATLETEWCQPLRDAGVRYDARTVVGDAAQSLMETGDELDAELLVVGRRGRGGLVELLVGSVPRKLSHYAELPLVIVPVVNSRDA